MDSYLKKNRRLFLIGLLISQIFILPNTSLASSIEKYIEKGLTKYFKIKSLQITSDTFGSKNTTVEVSGKIKISKKISKKVRKKLKSELFGKHRS